MKILMVLVHLKKGQPTITEPQLSNYPLNYSDLEINTIFLEVFQQMAQVFKN